MKGRRGAKKKPNHTIPCNVFKIQILFFSSKFLCWWSVLMSVVTCGRFLIDHISKKIISNLIIDDVQNILGYFELSVLGLKISIICSFKIATLGFRHCSLGRSTIVSIKYVLLWLLYYGRWMTVKWSSKSTHKGRLDIPAPPRGAVLDPETTQEVDHKNGSDGEHEVHRNEFDKLLKCAKFDFWSFFIFNNCLPILHIIV